MYFLPLLEKYAVDKFLDKYQYVTNKGATLGADGPVAPFRNSEALSDVQYLIDRRRYNGRRYRGAKELVLERQQDLDRMQQTFDDFHNNVYSKAKEITPDLQVEHDKLKGYLDRHKFLLEDAYEELPRAKAAFEATRSPEYKDIVRSLYNKMDNAAVPRVNSVTSEHIDSTAKQLLRANPWLQKFSLGMFANGGRLNSALASMYRFGGRTAGGIRNMFTGAGQLGSKAFNGVGGFLKSLLSKIHR